MDKKQQRKEHARMVVHTTIATPFIVYLISRSILLSIVSIPVTFFLGIAHGISMGLFDED